MGMTVAEIFIVYFADIVENLDIEGFVTYDYSYVHELDHILNISSKYIKNQGNSKD